MIEDQDQSNNEFTSNKKIIIGLVPYKGRRSLTQVKNIPKEYDLERIYKYWKKKRNCVCGIKEEGDRGDKEKKKDKKERDEENRNYFIELHGDHVEWVEQFLIYMGICTKENITKQGKVNT